MPGIGVDIVEIGRIADAIQRSGEVFLRRVYASEEIESGWKCDHPAVYFATSFAAKEAIIKALSPTENQDIDLREIQISRGEGGAPRAELKGEVNRAAQEKGFTRVLLSLSYETTHAIAMAFLPDD